MDEYRKYTLTVDCTTTTQQAIAYGFIGGFLYGCGTVDLRNVYYKSDDMIALRTIYTGTLRKDLFETFEAIVDKAKKEWGLDVWIES